MNVTLKFGFHAKQHNNGRSGMNVTLKFRFHAKQHNNGRSGMNVTLQFSCEGNFAALLLHLNRFMWEERKTMRKNIVRNTHFYTKLYQPIDILIYYYWT